jgi:hypothetical protein
VPHQKEPGIDPEQGFDRRPPLRDDNNTGRSSDRPPVSKRTSADASVCRR